MFEYEFLKNGKSIHVLTPFQQITFNHKLFYQKETPKIVLNSQQTLLTFLLQNCTSF